MARILIAGAGGAPSEGVIHSLKQVSPPHWVIGMGSEPSDLILSKADEVHLVPYANELNYENELLSLISRVKPDFVHFQNDAEIYVASGLREKIQSLGAKVFMPEHSVIDICVHKHKSYLAFLQAGVKVPKNKLIDNAEDLEIAFATLRKDSEPIWLRSVKIGGGGAGSLSTSNFEFARAWIEHHSGWGTFSAAEHLTDRTVTWTSIWFEGVLQVAQTRIRKGWVHGDRSVSGVTGVTKVGVTYSDDLVNDVATSSVRAVADKPHGIFSVDMAYDFDGLPNPTEINISRFFTTVRFFTEAGLNLPKLFVELGLDGKLSNPPEPLMNPIPNGLAWFRGMDTEPVLMSLDDYVSRFE